MGFAIHATNVAATGQPPASRGYAWRVFALTFGLMIFDYVDRQVVVSMFPHLKAQWSLSDAQLGALVAIVSIVVALGTVPLSLLADRWSRVKSMFVMALVWSLATIGCAFAPELRPAAVHARHRRPRRGGLRRRGRRAACDVFPGTIAQHGPRALPRRGTHRLGDRRRPRRRDRAALGLAGRLRRGRRARPPARVRVPDGRARLQDRRPADEGER
jgi:hypothetical protein